MFRPPPDPHPEVTRKPLGRGAASPGDERMPHQPTGQTAVPSGENVLVAVRPGVFRGVEPAEPCRDQSEVGQQEEHSASVHCLSSFLRTGCPGAPRQHPDSDALPRRRLPDDLRGRRARPMPLPCAPRTPSVRTRHPQPENSSLPRRGDPARAVPARVFPPFVLLFFNCHNQQIYNTFSNFMNAF